MDEYVFNGFLKKGTRYVADLAYSKNSKESFYPVKEMPVKGKKFCEEFKHQDACIDDCCEKPVTGKLAKRQAFDERENCEG